MTLTVTDAKGDESVCQVVIVVQSRADNVPAEAQEGQEQADDVPEGEGDVPERADWTLPAVGIAAACTGGEGIAGVAWKRKGRKHAFPPDPQ